MRSVSPRWSPTWPRGALLVAAMACLSACLSTLGSANPSDATATRTCPKPVTLRCAGESIHVRVGDGYDEGESAAENRLRVQQFDAVTFSNFTWSNTEPAPNRWDFSSTDAEIAFAKHHHLYVTADHFLWDQVVYHSTPSWVMAINNPIQLQRAMLDYISAFTKRYGNAINQWTVVNEPLTYIGDTSAIQPNHFSEVLGPDWIADAFRIAHEGAPHAALWLNEVFTEDDPAKAHALVVLATDLVAQHVPINGVSLEGHLFTPDLKPMSPDFSLVHQTLEQLSALGLQVSLSEIDDPTFPTTGNRFGVQASNISRLVAACLDVPNCVSINFWDIDDSKSWLDALFNNANVDPTLFTTNLRPKLAFTAVVNTLLVKGAS